MENPYTLVFGKTPSNYIARSVDVEEIVYTFKEKDPSVRTYMITGVRGCGKTVALSEIERTFRNREDFIVLSLNCDTDLISQAAEELYRASKKNSFLRDTDITLSLPGVTIGKRISEASESPAIIIDTLLDKLTKNKKRILFCMDEASNTKNVRSFCQAFNIWLRKDYDVLFLLTGLKKNVINLQEDDSVSFLKRAERIELSSLNTNEILCNYRKYLGVTEKEAAQMAILTKGYPYAFQLLGYLCFKNSAPYSEVLQQFDDKLSNNVYDLIWKDLTTKEKEVMTAIINTKSLVAKDIIRFGGFTQNTYNQYRNILIMKGLIQVDGYGKISLTLPRFDEIAMRNLDLGLWT